MVERQHRSKSPLHATQAKRFDATRLHEATPAGPAPPPATGDMVKAKVAKGRSIDIPIPGAAPEFFRYEKITGKEVTHGPIRCAGPGEVVELPASEVDRLRALGFLEWPDKRFVTNEEAAMTGVTDDVRLKHGLSKPTVAQR
jgi:hypothetical protein